MTERPPSPSELPAAVSKGVLVALVTLSFALMLVLLAPGGAERLADVVIRVLMSIGVVAVAILAWLSGVLGRPPEAAEGPVFQQLDSELGSLGDVLGRSREQGMWLTTILDAMAEGVVVCSPSTHVLLVNKAARELLDLRTSPVEGRLLLEVHRSPLLRDAIDEAVSEQRVIRRELVLRRQDTLHLAVVVAPIFEEEVVRGAVAVLHDISPIRHLERIRRDFVANVSHELRTPLATISGYAETLLSGAVELEPVATDFIEVIERNAGRLTVMVEDLLVLAKLEARGERRSLDSVRLFGVVADVVEAVEPIAEDKEIDLVVEVDHVPPILAERRALTQVMRNLVENAIKYTDSGGCIFLRADPDPDNEGRVRVKVTDTGIGIEPRHLPRIFERFYRVDDGRSREDGGTGLGLAIVKHMVLAMDGEIDVESRPGEGSTFSVWLKIAAQERADLQEESVDDRDALRA
ncbi:MAG: histidine kinase [Myxococcales bacterium]|nr:histidine kinase [Myxococcales bacterium]